MADWRPFWILLVRNLAWAIIVWDVPFHFIFMVQLFCIFLSHLNITKLLKFKMAAKRHFSHFCSQKGIRSLADIAEHICQIKRRYDFATQRTSLLVESKLLNSEFDSLSNDDKFIYIMSSTHRPLVICLAKYTYSCFQTLSVSRTSAL